MTTAHGGRDQFTLVLGGGGTVGLAYHAGVLKALADVCDIEAADARLIVGTSAGSVIGAYLRCGYSSDDLWQMAIGTHPSLDGIDDDELERRRRALFTPAWTSRVELVRRSVGSSYALLRSVTKAPALPTALRRQFPAGMFTMASGKEQLERELSCDWPVRPLWLCSFDIVRRQRVVLGRDDSSLSLPWAVLASCAIPGVYRPVRDGRRILVDGGAYSTTNLDLATEQLDAAVIAVAPMAFDPGDAPSRRTRLARRRAAMALDREARLVERTGHDLLVLRPSHNEIRAHGHNLMRADDTAATARLAYDCTTRMLDENGGYGAPAFAGAAPPESGDRAARSSASAA